MFTSSNFSKEYMNTIVNHVVTIREIQKVNREKTQELKKQIQEQLVLIENLNSRLEEIEGEKMTQLENQLSEMFRKW